MNKADLISSVAKATNLSKDTVSDAIEATLGEITNALKSGDEVRIVGFGNFQVTDRAASEGRNPRTGESIQIAAKNVVKFKPGAGLSNAVN